MPDREHDVVSQEHGGHAVTRSVQSASVGQGIAVFSSSHQVLHMNRVAAEWHGSLQPSLLEIRQEVVRGLERSLGEQGRPLIAIKRLIDCAGGSFLLRGTGVPSKEPDRGFRIVITIESVPLR